MSLPDVVSREQWLEARRRLLTREKEFTRAHDALNADRRRLPMVKVDKEYVFDGPDGAVTLAELFGDKRQLIVQHVMFGPDWDQPCPGCSAAIAELSPGVVDHLGTRETTFVLVSRAPYEKIAPALRGPMQDRHGHHHGIRADPHALAGTVSVCWIPLSLRTSPRSNWSSGG
jgi:predicted dithiol-disulfide oxidoreductase (DUF899 family)